MLQRWGDRDQDGGQSWRRRASALYPFIGACQLTAAVLLLVPRTALVGTLVHLPIHRRHRVITTTVGFRGTWLIVSLMLVGVVFLLCWDWHRLRALVDPDLAVPAAAGTRRLSASR